ncbi:MAG TPA: hypothetical protein DEV93_09985 [Chloroflexi bacterium]|nr:hypothetical protein [Chloroflexota bacterium]
MSLGGILISHARSGAAACSSAGAAGSSALVDLTRGRPLRKARVAGRPSVIFMVKQLPHEPAQIVRLEGGLPTLTAIQISGRPWIPQDPAWNAALSLDAPDPETIAH